MEGWKAGVEVHEVGNGGGSTQEVRESVENDAVGSFFDLFMGNNG